MSRQESIDPSDIERMLGIKIPRTLEDAGRLMAAGDPLSKFLAAQYIVENPYMIEHHPEVVRMVVKLIPIYERAVERGDVEPALPVSVRPVTRTTRSAFSPDDFRLLGSNTTTENGSVKAEAEKPLKVKAVLEIFGSDEVILHQFLENMQTRNIRGFGVDPLYWGELITRRLYPDLTGLEKTKKIEEIAGLFTGLAPKDFFDSRFNK